MPTVVTFNIAGSHATWESQAAGANLVFAADKEDTGTERTVDEASEYACEVWANSVDVAFDQINEAFNGTRTITALDVGGDVTVGDALDLTATNAVADFGDGSGTPQLRLISGVQSVIGFYDTNGTPSLNDKAVRFDDSSDLVLQHHDGNSFVSALTIDNNADVSIANDVTVGGDARVDGFILAMSAQDGNGTIIVDSSDAGTATLDLRDNGTSRFSTRLSSSGNAALLYARDSGGSIVYTTSYDLTDGSWDFPGDVTVGGAFNHDGSTFGAMGATPVTRPTVTGSRGGNAALASLCTALENLGLITDSTT